MLKCPTYIGEIHHKGAVHTALHDPIIAREVWDQTQALLEQNLQGKTRQRVPSASLLAGKVVDSQGEPLIAVHATKGATRYRYYVSRALHQDPGSAGMRIPAKELEAAVCGCIGEQFEDVLALADKIKLDAAPHEIAAIVQRGAALQAALSQRDRSTLQTIVFKVSVLASAVEIECSASAIATLLGVPCELGAPTTLTISASVRLTRTGRAMRLIQSNGAPITQQPDAALIRLLLRARGWWSQLKDGEIDVKRLAARERVNPSYVTRVLRLAFLAPEVIEAVLRGEISGRIDAAALTATDAIPGCWAKQKRLIVGEA